MYYTAAQQSRIMLRINGKVLGMNGLKTPEFLQDMSFVEKAKVAIEANKWAIMYYIACNDPRENQPIIIGLHALPAKVAVGSFVFNGFVAALQRKGWKVEAIEIRGDTGEHYTLSVTKSEGAVKRCKTTILSLSRMRKSRLHLSKCEQPIYERLCLEARKAIHHQFNELHGWRVMVPLALTPEEMGPDISKNRIVTKLMDAYKEGDPKLEQIDGVWYMRLI